MSKVSYVAECRTCAVVHSTEDYSDREDFIYLHRDAGHQVVYWIEGPR